MTRKRRIAVAVVLVFAAVLAVPAGALLIGYCKLMYVGSESMEPTMVKGDRFVARMSVSESLNRGDIVLFEARGGSLWSQRVAGLPGDRVEMVDGILYLNGRPVAQRFLRTDPVERTQYGSQARRLSEQFPGEAAPHEIYDLGRSAGDDMAPQVVASGHLFLLGDNRDQSADSRYSGDFQGVGQVPIAAVRGVPWFYHMWSRFGQPAGH